MKKNMSTNAIIGWLEGWVSKTHCVQNNDNAVSNVFQYQKIKSNTSGGSKKF